jgi:hypothetical protein
VCAAYLLLCVWARFGQFCSSSVVHRVRSLPQWILCFLVQEPVCILVSRSGPSSRYGTGSPRTIFLRLSIWAPLFLSLLQLSLSTGQSTEFIAHPRCRRTARSHLLGMSFPVRRPLIVVSASSFCHGQCLSYDLIVATTRIWFSGARDSVLILLSSSFDSKIFSAGSRQRSLFHSHHQGFPLCFIHALVFCRYQLEVLLPPKTFLPSLSAPARNVFPAQVPPAANFLAAASSHFPLPLMQPNRWCPAPVLCYFSSSISLVLCLDSCK